MGNVAEIWRHSIKAHGREALLQVNLKSGEGLPGDRIWAVAHDAAQLTDPLSWAHCRNFSRAAKAPLLMAITSSFDAMSNTVTLTHPNQPGITINPDLERDNARFIEWVTPLCPASRSQPKQLIRGNRALTDTDFASVSLINLASHHELSDVLDQKLSPLRWRGNLILNGLTAWQERLWVGKRLRIGDAELEIRDHITRCQATTANPRTGKQDADTLGALQNGWNHQEFGVYGHVVKSGPVHVDSPVELIT